MRGGTEECAGTKRVVQVCNYAVIIANLDSGPAKNPDLPLLTNQAEDLNLLTAVFLVEILWNCNYKHMAGAHKCFKIIDHSGSRQACLTGPQEPRFEGVIYFIYLSLCRTLQQLPSTVV